LWQETIIADKHEVHGHRAEQHTESQHVEQVQETVEVAITPATEYVNASETNVEEPAAINQAPSASEHSVEAETVHGDSVEQANEAHTSDVAAVPQGDISVAAEAETASLAPSTEVLQSRLSDAVTKVDELIATVHSKEAEMIVLSSQFSDALAVCCCFCCCCCCCCCLRRRCRC
jgi:beta-mannanase